jgi:hypothetical protein
MVSNMAGNEPGNPENFVQKFSVFLDEIGWKFYGSRNVDGNVPNVNWNGDKFKVNCCNPSNPNDNLRLRVEVSAKKGALFRALFSYRPVEPIIIHFGNFGII